LNGKKAILECRGTLLSYAGGQTYQFFHFLLWDPQQKNKMDLGFRHSKGSEPWLEANWQAMQRKVYFSLILDGWTTLNLLWVNLMTLRILIYNFCSISSAPMEKSGPLSQNNSLAAIQTTLSKTFSMPP
jgi:hypothetical protein